MKPNEHNPIHSHGGMFSFVMYVDIDDKIRNDHKNEKGNSPSRGVIQFLSGITSESVVINPKVGDILIFNSSHRHVVYPFKADCKRISIAGNVHDCNVKDNS